MIDEVKLENLKRKYITEGINQNNVRKVRKEIKNELLGLIQNAEEMDSIWEEIKNAGEEAKTAVGIAGSEVNIRDLNKKIDNTLKGVIVHKPREGSPINLGTKHLKTLKLNTVTLNRGVSKGDYDSFIGTIQGLIVQGKAVNLPNVAILEDVLHKVSSQWANKSSSQDLDNIVGRSADIFDEISGADIKYAKERKGVYRYWEGISQKYDRLDDSVKKLKEVVSKGEEFTSDFKEIVSELKLPPDYVLDIKSFKMKLERPEYRIINFLKNIGGEGARGYSKGEQTNFERRQGSDRSSLFTTLQEPVPESKPIDFSPLNMRQGDLLNESTKDLEDIMTEGYVDPILWWVINEELLDIPVIMVDGFNKEWRDFASQGNYSELDTEDVEGKLSQVISKLKKDSPEAEKAIKVLNELSEVAGDKVDVAYLPAAAWLKEINSNLFNTMDKIEKQTSEFFQKLNGIFIEGEGQFPVSMTSTHPKHRGRHGGSPATFYAKRGLYPVPDAKGLKRPRAQSYVPSKPRTFKNEKLNDASKVLFKALKDYYWVPLGRSGNHFIEGQKPKFSGDIQGEFPYRLFKFTFGNTPEIRAQKTILSGSADNIKSHTLRKIKDYLTSSTSEKITNGVQNYIVVVEQVVRQLDKIFTDAEDKESNKIWGAGKIGRALKRSLSEITLDELEYFKEPLLPLYEKYENIMEKGGEEELPIYSLRTLLMDNNLQNILRSKERFMQKKEFETMIQLVKDIIELTDPERVNSSDEIGKAILKVHDSIRKMENKVVIYDTLYLNDINTTDYIITKMEKEFKLDITSLEINDIVKSCDSFENLSKRFGVGKEVIYVIKGLCR